MSNTDVSAVGTGMLMGMLHMPNLVSSTASDSPIVLSAANAVAEAYGRPLSTAANSGTGESHMDALQADAAAAQPREQHLAASISPHEAALKQLKKACKAAKGPKKKPGQKKQQLVCKVDGCGVHLGQTKAYYQRHKVCAVHLSAMSAQVNGVDSRFCQQCGKFQPLEEFDADKRSCRARLKRHNNRRREQRHNKSYEFALELRQAAAQYLAGEDEEGGYDPYYAQYGMTAAGYYPGRYNAQGCYQGQSYAHSTAGGLPASLIQAPDMTAVAAAAAAAMASEQSQQQQMQQPALGGLVTKWPGMECGISPKHSKGTTGDGSGSGGGGHSEGTTATAAPTGPSSPGISPSDAAAAAATAGTAAGAGAVGTPTSGRPTLRRVSANRALEALRSLNASSYSTESDWDDESEDGARSPTGAHWHHHRRPGMAAAASRLQGSRLRTTDSCGPNQGYPAVAASAPGGSMGGYDPQQGGHMAGHMGHVMPAGAMGQTPRAASGSAAFQGTVSYLNPNNAAQQQQQPWGNNGDYDLQGWDGSLSAHLHQQQQDQQQDQQQQWGSAYDGSYGGAATGSAGGNSYEPQFMQGTVSHLSAGGGIAAGPLPPGIHIQRSNAAAGICYSRSNSPAVSTGGAAGPPPAAAAGAASLLGQVAREGPPGASHGQLPAGPLPHGWSLAAPAHEFCSSGSNDQQTGGQMGQQLHHLSDPGQQYQQGMQQEQQPAPAQGACGFVPMQVEDLQQILQAMVPNAFAPANPAAMAASDATAAAHGGCSGTDGGCGPGVDVTGQGHAGDGLAGSPPEANECFNPLALFDGMPDNAAGQPGSFMVQPQQGDNRPLSPKSSMTAAAAAAAAALASSGRAPQHCMPQGYQPSHGLAVPPGDQQQACMPPGLPLDGPGRVAMAATAAATALQAHASTGSPDSTGATGGLMMGQVDMGGVQAAGGTDSGNSALRDELAGVTLGQDSWEAQQQMQMQGADMHMTEAPCPGSFDLQQSGSCFELQQPQQLPGLDQHSMPTQSDSPMCGDVQQGQHAGMQEMGAAACMEQEQHNNQQVQQQQGGYEQQDSPVDFDSFDTAAAAATFEAQLAACCGNRDSQEAVFRAWLDALLPGQQQAVMQQQQQAQQQDCAQQPYEQGSQTLTMQQQAPLDGLADSPGSPGGFDEPGRQYEDDPLPDPGDLDSPGVVGMGHHDFAEDDDVDVDVDAAAAALHLVAQRECGEDDGAHGGNLTAEEDFRELLDLLLDA